MCITLAGGRGGGISQGKWCCHITILIINGIKKKGKNETRGRQRREERERARDKKAEGERNIPREQKDQTKGKGDKIRL